MSSFTLKIKALFFVAAAVFFAAAFQGVPSVSASADDITLPSSITMDYSADEIVLPVLDVKAEWSYKITIYDYHDTAYAQPIGEKVYAFKFASAGAYRLKYMLEKADESPKTLYTLLNLVDEVKPSIDFTPLKKVYEKNARIQLSYTASDNSGKFDIVLAVWLNGEDISKQLSGNTLIADKEGTYVISILATDTYGNFERVAQTFTVGNAAPNDGGLSPAIIVLIAAGSTAVAGVAVFFIIRFARSRRAKEVK